MCQYVQRHTRSLYCILALISYATCQLSVFNISTGSPTTINPRDRFTCQEGFVIPKWNPSENIAPGDRFCRALVYFVTLCYMFIGVSIVADKFMSAIETITAKERDVKVTKPSGEEVTVRVKIWNDTVSNLTLMALGSSAPEIMLSALEVIGKLNISLQ